MMNPLLRLKQHSGLPTSDGEIPGDTLAEYLYRIQRGGQALILKNIVAEIIDCLEILNQQINQETGVNAPPIERQLAYAVSGIVSSCLDKAMELQQTNVKCAIAANLLCAAWCVQCAWDALLAGDIENLPSHVEGELWGRDDRGRVV